MRSVLPQHFSRGPGAVRQVVRHIIKRPLNAMGGFETAQLAEFGGGEPLRIGFFGHSSFFWWRSGGWHRPHYGKLIEGSRVEEGLGIEVWVRRASPRRSPGCHPKGRPPKGQP